ncbi:hypothetical protein Tco_0886749 [Tanacetum coccineum]
MEEALLLDVHHEFFEWRGCSREAKSRYNSRLATLIPKLIYSPQIVDWAFNIREPIYLELCREFYATYKFDEVCADNELQSKKIISFRLGERAHSLTFLEFARRLGLYHADELEEEGFDTYFQGGLRNDENFNAREYWERIGLDRDLHLSRSSITSDLYERMGSIEIRQEAIERMEYRHAYHWHRYQGVFEHMVGVYNVMLQGSYNPPRHAQPQYDQYYQQYYPQQPPQQQHDDEEDE